jgi:asparagine synthase (glutamine-hydrolysing)
MCGITGFFNFNNSFKKIKKSLQKIKNRGLDNFGVYDFNKVYNYKNIKDLKIINSKNIVAHNLLKIVGNIRQPLTTKDKRFVFLSNQEIYNWKELSIQKKIKANNDTELLFKLLIKNNKIDLNKLNMLKGVWSFVLIDNKENKLYISRDIIGVKPLWYYYNKEENKFAFCSEKKGLVDLDNKYIKLLDPRYVLIYDINKNKINFKERKFINFPFKKNKLLVSENINTLEKKLVQSIKQRIPNKKFALLFSGGIDSLVIAKILKDLNYNFDLYFSYIKDLGQPKDLYFARHSSSYLNLKLVEVPITLNKLKLNLKKIITIIETSDPIQVGVALPIYFASKKAKDNKCQVLLSGLGSDEIFAGYNRFKSSNNIDLDSYNLLLQMHESNLYREDLISMNNNIEVRFPYLDLDLINFSFTLSKSLKINSKENKIILRKLAKKLNIPKLFYLRPKKAAQYGSNFDKAIIKLSKQNNFKTKSKYLASLIKGKNNLKLGCLFSGGKDSCLAYNIINNMNYKISCLLSILPTSNDSYMFQKPNINLLKLQSKSIGVDLLYRESKSIKEQELKDLELLIKEAIEKYNINGIVCGALFSNYQRKRIQDICNKLQLRFFAPLWNMPQDKELKLLLKKGFKFIICKVSALGLNHNYLGKIISEEDLKNFILLNKKYGFNVAGEGGEYETIVVDSPDFSKKINILDYKKVIENENSAYLILKKIKLVNKKFLI